MVVRLKALIVFKDDSTVEFQYDQERSSVHCGNYIHFFDIDSNCNFTVGLDNPNIKYVRYE